MVKRNYPKQIAVCVETLPQVAEFFGVSVGTVNGWRSRGMPGEAGVGKKPGRFDLQEIAEWRFNRDDMVEQSPESSRLKTLELAKLSQDIQIQNVKLQNLQRNLIDVDVATSLIQRIVAEHSGLCDELAARIRDLVPKPGSTIRGNDPAAIAEGVEALVNELREAMAAGLDGWSEELEFTQR